MNKSFWVAALMRALRTVCQAFLSYLTVASVLSEVNWLQACSAAVLAGLISIVTSVATGLPEV